MHVKMTLWLAGFLCLSPCVAPAQLSFRFLPEINGNNLNGLFTADLQNMGANTYEGNISISVKNSQGALMVQTVSPLISIRPGSNNLQSLAVRSQFQFGTQELARFLLQTGKFPEGEYEYCFEFTGNSDKANAGSQYFDNCFRQLIVPAFPLALVYPEDGDKLCDPKPYFRWQLPLPLNRAYRYELVLVEKRENQLESESIISNLPILLVNNIPSDMLLYPPGVPPLLNGKSYAWQVRAFQGNILKTKSEICTFSTSCEGNSSDSSINSYRQPGTGIDGNYYLVTDTLKFTVRNSYGPRELSYVITDLADASRKIDRLPEVQLTSGLNKVDLVLDRIRGLELRKIYLITIKNAADHFQYLRFIRKD